MANNPEPVMLELAHLPREQVGPFLLLGLAKDATREEIEAHWAERIKWARKGQITITLEEINWARELINDLPRRLSADATTLNADSAEGTLAQLARRYGLEGEQTGPSWQPIDEEKPLQHYQPAVEVPDREALRASLVIPEIPQEVPGVGRLLDQLVATPLDPWNLPL